MHSFVPLADKTHEDMRFTLYLLSRKLRFEKSSLSEKCLVFPCTPPTVLDMSPESAVNPLLSHLNFDFIKDQ